MVKTTIFAVLLIFKISVADNKKELDCFKSLMKISYGAPFLFNNKQNPAWIIPDNSHQFIVVTLNSQFICDMGNYSSTGVHYDIYDFQITNIKELNRPMQIKYFRKYKGFSISNGYNNSKLSKPIICEEVEKSKVSNSINTNLKSRINSIEEYKKNFNIDADEDWFNKEFERVNDACSALF